MNEHNHSNYSKRIATNTLVLFARMLIITIVNLYTVRWVSERSWYRGLWNIYNAVARSGYHWSLASVVSLQWLHSDSILMLWGWVKGKANQNILCQCEFSYCVFDYHNPCP